MQSKPKLLAVADSPEMTTGFGTVARNVLKTFHDMGFEIHLVARNWNGHCPDHDVFPYKFYTPTPRQLGATLGRSPDIYGYEATGQLLSVIKPDLVFILASLPDLTAHYVQNPQLKTYRTLGFSTFESATMPRWWLGGLQFVDQVVVFSEWQKRVLLTHPAEVVDPERLAVIPHGHEDRHIKPLWNTLDERDKLRESVGMPPNDCLFFRCDRNDYRKQHPTLIKAYNKFVLDNPDNNASLYFHMSYDDHAGWDMDDALDAWGKDIRDGNGVLMTKDYDTPWQGSSRTNLNLLYNIADYYVSTTGGEAWGLCLHESQAAGVPVIGPANSACTEVIHGGYKVHQLTTVDGMNCIEYKPPAVDAFADTMSRAYKDIVNNNRTEWWKNREVGLKWAASMAWENVLRPLPNLIDKVMARPKREIVWADPDPTKEETVAVS